SGPVVMKGNPDESLLYLVVTHQEEPRMPPGSPKMPDDRLELIRRWIAAGAPEKPGDPTIALPAGAPAAGSVMTAPALTAPASDKARRSPAMAAKAASKPRPRAVRPTALTALAASPDGSRLAVSDQLRVVVLDVNSTGLTPRAVLPFPEGEVYALRFGPS